MKGVSAEIKEAIGPETFVYAIRLGLSSSQDRSLSFFDDVNRQVKLFRIFSRSLSDFRFKKFAISSGKLTS